MTGLRRTHKSWQDFFLGSAVLGQYGHSVALEMAGRTALQQHHAPCRLLHLCLHAVAQRVSCLGSSTTQLTCLALAVGLQEERLHT